MTFDEFKILVKGMKAVYPEPWFLPDGDAVKIWYSLLQDIDYKVANAGIQKWMMTNPKAPSIADIRSMTTEVVQGVSKEWGDAWEDVLKAIRRYGMYRSDEAMETFDEITKQCVQRLGFKEICMSENIVADRANFRMIYEQLTERKAKDDVLPQKLKNLISTINTDAKAIGVKGE